VCSDPWTVARSERNEEFERCKRMKHILSAIREAAGKTAASADLISET
jgi:hypothetical protein